MERQPFKQRLEDWFFTLLYKLISHKVWVFLIATLLLMSEHPLMTIDVWKWVTIVFLGANVGTKAFNFARGKINGTNGTAGS